MKLHTESNTRSESDQGHCDKAACKFHSGGQNTNIKIRRPSTGEKQAILKLLKEGYRGLYNFGNDTVSAIYLFYLRLKYCLDCDFGLLPCCQIFLNRKMKTLGGGNTAFPQDTLEALLHYYSVLFKPYEVMSRAVVWTKSRRYLVYYGPSPNPHTIPPF